MYRTGLDQLRNRAVGLGAAHGGLTAVVVGVVSYVWARLAPVRAHVAGWVDHTATGLPDGVPWVAVSVVVGAVVLAAGATVLLLIRRPEPARVRTD